MEGALDELLRHPALWRVGDGVRDAVTEQRANTVSSGFDALDQRLPGGGWPLGALLEVLHAQPGIGELSLLLPALARLATDGRWLAWIAPPYRIAIPTLQAAGVDPARVLVVRRLESAEVPWAVEQALRSGACGAVLWWPGSAPGQGARGRRGQGFRQLRRLQLAAQAGHSMGVAFRPAEAAREASPSALRVLLAPCERGLRVELLKSRGGCGGSVLLETDVMTSRWRRRS